MQQMMGMYGNDPFGRFGGAGAAPSAPADSRPPEERFQVQLQVRHVVLLRFLGEWGADFVR